MNMCYFILVGFKGNLSLLAISCFFVCRGRKANGSFLSSVPGSGFPIRYPEGVPKIGHLPRNGGELRTVPGSLSGLSISEVAELLVEGELGKQEVVSQPTQGL